MISDNEFLPEKVLGISSDLQKKLYIFYLTTPRLLQLFGLIHRDSLTYELLFNFIKIDCSCFYTDVLRLITESESQQSYVFLNFVKFFGRDGVRDILLILSKTDFSMDKLLKKWHGICKKNGIGYVDFELIRIYRRFLDLKILSEEEKKDSSIAITDMDMQELALILERRLGSFEDKLIACVANEKGQSFLKNVTKSIYNNVQYKLKDIMEE